MFMYQFDSLINQNENIMKKQFAVVEIAHVNFQMNFQC